MSDDMTRLDDEVMWATSGTGEDFQCVHVDTAREMAAEIKRLQAYQNETAKAWTKLTESQEEEIAKLRLWAQDEQQKRERVEEQRMEARSEIERLKGEVVKWQIEAGKFGAGCPACDDIGEENDRLRAVQDRIGKLLEHLPGINDERDSIPLLLAIRDAFNEQTGQEKQT